MSNNAPALLSARRTKEVFYSPTPAREATVQNCREVRETCLMDSLVVGRNPDIGDMARLLRTESLR